MSFFENIFFFHFEALSHLWMKSNEVWFFLLWQQRKKEIDSEYVFEESHLSSHIQLTPIILQKWENKEREKWIY